jgi:hypothetical protein
MFPATRKVYVIRDPSVEGLVGIRYVGSTRHGLTERLQSHYDNAYRPGAKLKMNVWVKKMCKAGKLPTIHLIGSYSCLRAMRDAERQAIHAYLHAGCKLLNMALVDSPPVGWYEL